MLKLLRRQLWSFATNADYRKYVLQLLSERSAPRAAAAAAAPEGERRDFSSLRGKKAFLCGGCELTYIGDHLASLGLDVYHTFVNGRPAEPLLELSDPQSKFFTNGHDVAVFCQSQSFMQLLQKMAGEGAGYSEAEKQKDLADLLAQLRGAIGRANKGAQRPIFVVSHFNLNARYRGVHEYKSYAGGISYDEMLLRYKLGLFEIAKTHDNVYVLDVDKVFEASGKKTALVWEDRSGFFDHPTRLGARLVAEQALHELTTLDPKARRIKCAVFDLDNTLWRGVLREDGAANLYPAWSHLHVVEALVARGILVAVVSKNDPEERANVEQVIGKRVFDKLVSVKLNWLPKSQNVKHLAKQLNLGIDAFAFFDDNPVEREEVKTNAPGVIVFPETEILAALDDVMFEPIGALTEESASRTQMYKEQAQRAEAESAFDATDLTSFFKSCKFELEVVRPAPAMGGRIEELIQRTNQLNATGNRTRQAELKRMLGDKRNCIALAASLKDKFGDYGLIGVCVAQRADESWDIVEFDFSCRAMGKQVEHAVLVHLCHAVRVDGRKAVTIRFKKTSRNAEMRSLLQSFGFAAMEESDEAVRLRFAVDDAIPSYPEWFTMSLPTTSEAAAAPLGAS